ncbi:MAG: hypothetical protein JHC26_11610 [Thermofilum sp.]|uniref:hypothetical protein n=1 Tax=Thermofilum sp. TaxID=1961369 RepID=UPI002582CEA0|nr:hypothetical protein [Thermofilum sp.]MCI4409729.1 hypothetical protein [Thermofilum sp.]
MSLEKQKENIQIGLNLEIVGVTTIQTNAKGDPFIYIGKRYKDHKGKRVLVLIKLLEQ